MNLKNKTALIFFLLSFIFAIFSIPLSGAISYGRIERNAFATVAGDSSAALELTGFNGNAYSLKKNYENIGSITNHLHQPITLTVTIQPDFSGITNKNCWFGIEIGTIISVFEIETGPVTSKQVEIRLEPGESADVQAAVQHNESRDIIVSFRFAARDEAGNLLFELNDTPYVPRRIICY